jgi:hypothetical protein
MLQRLAPCNKLTQKSLFSRSQGYLYFWGVCIFITTAFSALLARWGMFDSNSPSAPRATSRKRAN